MIIPVPTNEFRRVSPHQCWCAPAPFPLVRLKTVTVFYNMFGWEASGQCNGSGCPHSSTVNSAGGPTGDFSNLGNDVPPFGELGNYIGANPGEAYGGCDGICPEVQRDLDNQCVRFFSANFAGSSATTDISTGAVTGNLKTWQEAFGSAFPGGIGFPCLNDPVNYRLLAKTLLDSIDLGALKWGQHVSFGSIAVPVAGPAGSGSPQYFQFNADSIPFWVPSSGVIDPVADDCSGNLSFGQGFTSTGANQILVLSKASLEFFNNPVTITDGSFFNCNQLDKGAGNATYPATQTPTDLNIENGIGAFKPYGGITIAWGPGGVRCKS